VEAAHLPQLFALFAPDSGRILTASSDKTARLWDGSIVPLSCWASGAEVGTEHALPDVLLPPPS
jgi:WD40 repeat protein